MPAGFAGTRGDVQMDIVLLSLRVILPLYCRGFAA